MNNIRDILNSEELKLVINAIEALSRSMDVDHCRSKELFRELALGDRFDAAGTLRTIIDEKTYYPGLKSVLAAGLVGWLFDEPGYNSLSFDGMCRAALEHMAAAEEKAGLATRRWDLGRDILARYVFTSSEFLSDIVDELGGYSAFMGASSREVALTISETDRFKWNTVLRALAYFHYGADLWREGNTLPPSLNRAVLIFAGLKTLQPDYSQEFVSRSLLHKHWTMSKSKLALVYSASSLPVGDRTLFQVIADQDFSYDRHKKILNRCVCRARFVSEHIFSCATDPQLLKISRELLGEGPLERFSPPELPRAERTLIKNSFQLPED